MHAIMRCVVCVITPDEDLKNPILTTVFGVLLQDLQQQRQQLLEELQLRQQQLRELQGQQQVLHQEGLELEQQRRQLVRELQLLRRAQRRRLRRQQAAGVAIAGPAGGNLGGAAGVLCMLCRLQGCRRGQQ